ncbi:unnamed protein product [Linum trigynum]|uniref:RNase H type-1 domain-containing protein n=1 Tax=Linum trigynum TaxID=586398 RepID=A0AAV2GCA1_9ROSI
MAKKVKGVCRTIEVEARALVMGLREANRRELSPLIVEMDCQVLVNQLKKGEEDCTELGLWCEELKVLARVNESLSGREVKWEFRSRKSNVVVHWLAHIGLGWDQQVVWVENPPLTLGCMIEADLGLGT